MRQLIEQENVLAVIGNVGTPTAIAAIPIANEDRSLLYAAFTGAGAIRIGVADHGVGIAPENLGRIFNHDFTTKKDGHGFGLPSGANAVRELGGRLSVASDVPGRGATFTIELPIEPPQKLAA